MTPTPDYLDKDVYSSDEKKLGKVTNIWDGTSFDTEHILVIGRLLGGDVFVPVNVVQESGEHLVVPFSAEFIKNGPALSEDRGASADDMELLHAYYREQAA